MSGIFPFQFPNAITGPDLQVWNNAAFDHDGATAGAATWWAHSLDSNSSKENLSPVPENENSPLGVKEVVPNSISKCGVFEEEEEREIDKEIEKIEKEIARLSSRLRALKLEKAERKIRKGVEKRGRIVAAKFMDNVGRRGLSMGPTEIVSGSKGKSSGITPQGRRVSCFWRIQEVDELKVIKERGKSASLSPKERKSAVVGAGKKAVTTVGGKKVGRKDDGVVGLIQPRTLFKDVGEKEKGKEKEKLLSNRKNGKIGRVVASRYNLGLGAEVRKRSLPESEKEEGNKRRVSQGNGVGQSGRVKKKWDVRGSLGEGSVTPSVVAAGDMLPKIRNLRCVNETPRDSGAAKRVADLVGRKSYFCSDDEGAGGAVVGDSFCQVLSFREDDV